MNTLETEKLFSQFAGERGPVEQLAAFDKSWRFALLNVVAIRQSALGLYSVCKDEKLRQEVDALCQTIDLTATWFQVCADELQQIKERAESGNALQ